MNGHGSLRPDNAEGIQLLSAAPPLFDADFPDHFMELLRWRRDVRHFDQRAVPEEDVRALLECAALAPSVGNAQPWRIVRLRSGAIREALAAHVDAANARAALRNGDLAQREHYLSLTLHGLREAPELMVVFCDEQTTTGHGLGIATMPEMLRYSCVMAIHTLWLAARTRDIGLGWISILDLQTLTATFDALNHWSLIALLCIGYPAEPSDTPELEHRGWQAREPLADRLFESDVFDKDHKIALKPVR